MKKLKLEIETLKVESFDATAAEPNDRGTVQGRDSTSDSGTAYTDCWGGGCGTTTPYTNQCAGTIDCSHGLSPYITQCDISCYQPCPIGSTPDW